jgi:hypothetical protein
MDCMVQFLLRRRVVLIRVEERVGLERERIFKVSVLLETSFSCQIEPNVDRALLHISLSHLLPRHPEHRCPGLF